MPISMDLIRIDILSTILLLSHVLVFLLLNILINHYYYLSPIHPYPMCLFHNFILFLALICICLLAIQPFPFKSICMPVFICLLNFLHLKIVSTGWNFVLKICSRTLEFEVGGGRKISEYSTVRMLYNIGIQVCVYSSNFIHFPVRISC